MVPRGRPSCMQTDFLNEGKCEHDVQKINVITIHMDPGRRGSGIETSKKWEKRDRTDRRSNWGRRRKNVDGEGEKRVVCGDQIGCFLWGQRLSLSRVGREGRFVLPPHRLERKPGSGGHSAQSLGYRLAACHLRTSTAAPLPSRGLHIDPQPSEHTESSMPNPPGFDIKHRTLRTRRGT